MKIYTELLQGSDEWFDARRGIITASEVKLLLSPSKLEICNNDNVKKHAYELAAQRVTKYTEPAFISDDMLRGKDGEIYAREIYREKYASVEEVGFITNEINGVTVGYSPDGLVGDDGLIEIKTRKQKYQMETLIYDDVPNEYMLQLQTGLLVSERKWIDFISYCGGMPLFVKRVYPDLDMQEKIINALVFFEAKINAIIEKYTENTNGLYMTERVNFEEIEV